MANQPFISISSEDESVASPRVPAITPSGPRKLIRPSLSASMLERRPRSRRDAPLMSHHSAAPAAGGGSSHAEAFYFQKQMQAQTLMVFVLLDGEQVEGAIEWYDTATIKVRKGSLRTLIYKSAIKYLYKAGEGQP
jgi:sRNA-binding regulator protein Hfq